MSIEPQTPHEFLQRLVGEWTFHMDATGPDGQPADHTGTETVRTLGGWALCEARGAHSGGMPADSVMSLGYDPARQAFVGTFVASMMSHLWIYEGQLDEAGTTLTLDTEGPSFEVEGQTTRYKDVIAMQGDDARTLSSSFLAPDGSWKHFMTMHYRRTR